MYFAASSINDAVSKTTLSIEDLNKAREQIVSTSNGFDNILDKQLLKIDRIIHLYKKYAYYYLYTEYCSKWTEEKREIRNPGGPPQLLVLFSKSIDIYSMTGKGETFTDEQFNDMVDIVKLIPKSLICRIGFLDDRNFITPFSMACFNTDVPYKAIKFLLENGANPNSFHYYKFKKIHILTDLQQVNKKRYEELKPLLEKHGAVEEVFKESLF